MNDKTFYLLANSSSKKKKINLGKDLIARQSYLNKDNFNKLNENNFSLLNLEDSTNKSSFESYEIKLIQVK